MASNQQDIESIEAEQECLKNVDLIKQLQNLPPGLRSFNTTTVSALSRSTAPPKIRLLIACPKSGTTLLMRTISEVPNCAVASRIALMGNATGDGDYRILSRPETVTAYQQAVENQPSNAAVSSHSFKVLPPPINFTAAKPVFLVRDPVRVYDSWKHHNLGNLESFVDCYQSLFDLKDKNVTPPLVLVYEKFVRNPTVEFSRVRDHWDIESNVDSSTFKRDFATFSINIEQEGSLHRVDPPRGVFDTVSSHSQIRPDIPSHGTLSSQEIYDIEQRLGRLYLRNWQSEIKNVRDRLLRAKWFAFDLDDTLHEFRRASTAAIDAVFRAIISDPPPSDKQTLTFEALKSAYATVLASKTASAFVDGKTSHEYRADRIRATLTALSIENTSPEQIATWTAHYETALVQNHELKCGVVDLFTALKSLGKKIAIITEGPQDAQERTIAHLGLTPFTDFLATTNRLGVAKTEGLFGRVIEEIGVAGSGDDFVMVGDSFERDIRPAREAGMHCVHYTEKENFDVGGEIPKVNTLKKLEFMLLGNE